jgi:hypothetical protein
MIEFGKETRQITVIKYRRRTAKWQQSVTALLDGANVQIMLPISTYVTPGVYKLKIKFIDQNNVERKDIAYEINPEGLLTIYLNAPDSGEINSFSGKLFLTQRK